MTKTLQDMEIAIIGTEDQTSIMRLAGVSKFCRVDDDTSDVQGAVREGLDLFLKDPVVGIIMIPEDWTYHVADMLERMRKAKGVQKKAIIEYPPNLMAERVDVKSFYSNYTKKLIGFNVEL